MEEREHFYAPSHTNSLRTVEPPTSHYASSMKPSHIKLWHSPFKNFGKGMVKHTVKPKGRSWFVYVCPIMSALLAAALTTGIYGTIALVTKKSVNTTVLIGILGLI
ncbi:unnamed protein product [Rotaria magnacalcarata]|uniref:Uncharacterized protein n=3 Tax=Rotaria magnacalcarata TaxID=392030 RepID=A0A816Z631_9BILA|nr:unnamed protein product [Rotaria magnacalcarata]CAF2187791.1 unnamed protein product [Rotaria magnacalcarata]CAF4085050.1 unnamed protein product [Rotaria magnacalcarata]